MVIFSFFLSFYLGWFLLRVLIPHLNRGFLDHPNFRSSHQQPTPSGGGVAFAALASVSSLMAILTGQGLVAAALPLFAAPLAVVGLLDDRQNLPASWRYGVQLFTAAVMLGFSPLVQRIVLAAPSAILLNLSFFALLLIAVTALINFTNFMDGLDGLVAGCMAVSIVALSIDLIAPWSLWALVGSLLGFLIWNWSPAKVFMGDVGSTFLGAVFAGLVLQASSWSVAFAYLLVATPLITDACVCVLRRLFAGQPVFQAHRLHLFQRLHLAGWPHARVSITYIVATVVLAVAMLVGGWPWVLGLAVVVILFGVWLDQSVAVSFASASRN